MIGVLLAILEMFLLIFHQFIGNIKKNFMSHMIGEKVGNRTSTVAFYYKNFKKKTF